MTLYRACIQSSCAWGTCSVMCIERALEKTATRDTLLNTIIVNGKKVMLFVDFFCHLVACQPKLL